jgi:hypothetical protein
VTPVTLRMDRLDGTELTIENADRLADLFFALDRSSRGDDSYDAVTSRTSPTRIERVDVDAINGPMRARSKPEVWQDLFDMPDLPWLAAVDPGCAARLLARSGSRTAAACPAFSAPDFGVSSTMARSRARRACWARLRRATL